MGARRVGGGGVLRWAARIFIDGMRWLSLHTPNPDLKPHHPQTPGMALATMFVTLPYVVRELIPILESMDLAEEEAARTLGANDFQVCMWFVCACVWSLYWTILNPEPCCAGVLERDPAQHPLGPALWHHSHQCARDGRVWRRERHLRCAHSQRSNLWVKVRSNACHFVVKPVQLESSGQLWHVRRGGWGEVTNCKHHVWCCECHVES